MYIATIYTIFVAEKIIMDTLRNILAFMSTFIFIATLTMIICSCAVRTISKKAELKSKEEKLVFYIGIALALALIPFYYLPC